MHGVASRVLSCTSHVLGANDMSCAGARRCLLNDFTLAAAEESCQIRSLERAQSACSPMRTERACSMPTPQLPTVPAGLPKDCMTSPQALTMSASPNDTWQPGRLREFMQVQSSLWPLLN